MGGLQAKSMTSQRNRAEPSQDGGNALLWQRYDNKMVAMRYYGNVVIFYIFNSTVIDWTCYMFFCHCVIYWHCAQKISSVAVLMGDNNCTYIAP